MDLWKMSDPTFMVWLKSWFEVALGIEAASFFVLKSKKDIADSPTDRERPKQSFVKWFYEASPVENSMGWKMYIYTF